ncbi:glutaredoxin-like domain-containing protein [Globomyces pollinis-pini]|nr:glutaredoxin-like domain-containing protein [Globomyces pollinis-pini]
MIKSFVLLNESKIMLTLFSKNYCGLCEEALYELQSLQSKQKLNSVNLPKFDIEVIDIEQKENKVWKEKYYLDIPVLHLNEFPIMKHAIDPTRLSELLVEFDGISQNK